MLGACHPTYVVEQRNQPAPTPAPAPVEPEVSYQNFYDELSPYGRWIDYPGYGYVWMPAAGPDFRPYATNGYWLYTDMGWTWTSNYTWGWAPFHYGRWFYEGGYGWMWMPGNEWSPAWVSWRSNNDYYGWAPLGPNVRGDAYGGSYNPPSNYWCFVPHQYISNPRVSNYYVNETRNVTIINNTTIINTRVVNVNSNNNTRVNNPRTVYINGPDRQEVERATGAPIRPAVIRENNRPGEQVGNGQYTIYRPRVNSAATRTTNNQVTRVAPARVESLRDVRPMSTPSSNANAVGNSSQPVIRNANNSSNNNVVPANNNSSVRPVFTPSSNANAGGNTNQPVIRNANNNNNNNNSVAPANNNNARPTESLPSYNTRSQQSVNNNPPVNNRVSQPVNRPVTTRPVNESRAVTNNSVRASTTQNNPAPANSSVRSSGSNNNNAAQNSNKNASQLNQARKSNVANANASKPVEKKDKKDE